MSKGRSPASLRRSGRSAYVHTGAKEGGVESTRMAQMRLTAGARSYDWSLTHIFATSCF